jgi:hypothetical protein
VNQSGAFSFIPDFPCKVNHDSGTGRAEIVYIGKVDNKMADLCESDAMKRFVACTQKIRTAASHEVAGWDKDQDTFGCLRSGDFG